MQTKLNPNKTSRFSALINQPWQAYYTLCKPRVVALMLLTVMVGMYLATPPGFSFKTLFFTLLGVGLTASGAAALNHLVDQKIDAMMKRTQHRPLVQGSVSSQQALGFACLVGISGVSLLYFYVNQLTALLCFVTLIGYAGIYTGYLKRATPQNIVIGGLSGAMPPLLGYTAVTNQLSADAFLLVLIIFIWTPPHFWALAIHRLEEYRKADIPMLPVTHGVTFTKLNILLYTILLLVISLLPYFTGMSGVLYLISALVLGGRFLYWAIVLFRTNDNKIAMLTFRFSIIYLMALFVFLLLDHYFRS